MSILSCLINNICQYVVQFRNMHTLYINYNLYNYIQYRVSIFQQKCVDFNHRLGQKICGFDPYIRTINGPDSQYNPYIVATRNIVK